MATAGDELDNPITGERIVFQRTAGDTNGELLEFDLFAPGRNFGGSEHVHPEMEERFEIIEGSARLRVAGVERTLGAGEVLTVEPGTPHQGWNAGDGELWLRIQLRPALREEDLLEQLFGWANEGRVDAEGIPEAALVVELLRKYPRQIAPPPGP